MTNIYWNEVKEEDLLDRSFVFDVYVLTTKNINPFSLKQKMFDVKNREMIHMFWEECNELSFFKHFWKSDNSMYLNGKNVIYPHVPDIVWKYLEEDEETLTKLKRNWSRKNIYFSFSIQAHILKSLALLKNAA